MFQLRANLLGLSAVFFGALSALALAACQGSPDDIWTPDPGQPAILRELGVPQSLPVAPSGAQGSFATARGTAGQTEADIDLLVTGGSIELWAPSDGLLVVQDLEVELADVVVPPEVLPPQGAYLTGVGARLATPVSVDVTEQGGTVSVIASLDLEAHWALASADGTVFPMSRISLDKVPFSLEISRNALGRLEARLVGFRDGPFWRWAGTLELGDLTVDLRAGGGEGE